MPSDPYALLGVDANATDDEIKRAVPQARARAAPRREPGESTRPRRASRRSPSPTRRCATPSGGGATTCSATTGAARAAQPRRRGVRFRRPVRRVLPGRIRRRRTRRPAAARRTPRRSSSSTSATRRSASPRRSSCLLPVACDRCDGSGCEPGTHPARCDACGGAGEVRQVRRSILGQLVTAVPCVACGGTGQRDPESRARAVAATGGCAATRHIEVEVPAGIDDGQRLRLTGRGPAAPRNGVAGDLYVTVRVRPHPSLERHGFDLVHQRRIAMTQAALGHRAHRRHARRARGGHGAARAPSPATSSASGPWCPGAPGAWARRSPGADRRRRPAGALRRGAGTSCASSRSFGAKRSHAPAEGGFFAKIRSTVRGSVTRTVRGRGAGASRTSSSTTSTATRDLWIEGDDGHHLQRARRLRVGEAVDGERRARLLARGERRGAGRAAPPGHADGPADEGADRSRRGSSSRSRPRRAIRPVRSCTSSSSSASTR